MLVRSNERQQVIRLKPGFPLQICTCGDDFGVRTGGFAAQLNQVARQFPNAFRSRLAPAFK